MGEVKVIGKIMKEQKAKKEISFKNVEPAKSYVNFDEIFTKIADSKVENYQGNDTITTLVRYFLGNPRFDQFRLVDNTPDINKGLLVYGTYGVGKSMFFEIMHELGRKVATELHSSKFLFGTYTAPGIVTEYMSSTKGHYSGTFNIDQVKKGRLYIDDLGAEELCFNKYELMEDILFHRHRNRSVTFITTNLTPAEISKRYGPRLEDRLGEMFNMIEWKGESFRDGPRK